MQKTIVSVCYDGSAPGLLVKHAKTLDTVGLRATFFADPPSVLAGLATWRNVHAAGHEIGNGTLLASALPDGSLPAFSREVVLDEIREAQRMLAEVFGREARCVALPHGADRCADGSYWAQVGEIEEFVRIGVSGVNRLPVKKSNELRSMLCDRLDSGAMIEKLVAEAGKSSWVLMVFTLRLSHEATHTEFLKHLADHSEDYSVETVVRAATASHRPSPQPHLS